MIVDTSGRVLPDEFLRDGAYQPHYQTISSDRQVQIYQELSQDDDHRFTTSFLKLSHHIKDNRLLPKGWRAHPEAVDGIDPRFFEATLPVGNALEDADFMSGQGEDIVTYRIPVPGGATGKLRVTARLFFQALPPSYLQQRFLGANGPATQRLQYLTSHLATQDRAIADWKTEDLRGRKRSQDSALT